MQANLEELIGIGNSKHILTHKYTMNANKNIYDLNRCLFIFNHPALKPAKCSQLINRSSRGRGLRLMAINHYLTENVNLAVHDK